MIFPLILSNSPTAKINFDGKFLFKKENQLRLELKNLIIVSDGKTNWNYNKKQNKVIITNYDENDPPQFR